MAPRSIDLGIICLALNPCSSYRARDQVSHPYKGKNGNGSITQFPQCEIRPPEIDSDGEYRLML